MEESIREFIDEIRKSDLIENEKENSISYNGVSSLLDGIGVEQYQDHLDELYIHFKLSLVGLSEDERRALKTIMEEIYEQLPLPPSEECILAMRRDYDGKNESLGRDIQSACFLNNLMSIQRLYLQKSINSIMEIKENSERTDSSTIEIEVPEYKDINVDKKYDENTISGVQAFAKYIHVSLGTANKINKSGILEKNGICYWAGNSRKYKKDKLDELLINDPNAFKGLPK